MISETEMPYDDPAAPARAPEMSATDQAREQLNRSPGSLFEPGAYDNPQLKLETVDGRRIDEIVIGFTGQITLDRRDPDDVALYRRLVLGREVEFRIDTTVAGDSETIKPATEQRGETLVGKRTVRVHTLEAV